MSADFWDVAGELMAGDSRLVAGTIMGQPCLRLGDEFVAMPEHKADRMVVKLDAGRVAELITSGVADSFAPAGKVFKEWAAIADPAEWKQLLKEAINKADH